MRLLLSSDTLPDATLDELLQACRRRSLAGLELSLGARQGHGLDEQACPIHQQSGAACVPDDVHDIAWLRLPPDPSLVMLMIWSGAAYQMKAGLLLGEPVLDPPVATNLALIHGTDPAAAKAAAAWAQRHGATTCWDVTPGRLAANEIGRVLDDTMPTLAHVRLPGSGPEADLPDSAGTGGLLVALSTRGYTGSISLVPSPGTDPDLWRRWLLQKRGWGCGTAAAKQEKRSTCATL